MKEKELKKIISIFTLNRIKVMLQLFDCQKITCGCDLVKKIKIPKNLLSYHIGFLKENGFIEETRCGQKKNYSLSEKGFRFVEQFKKIKELI